MWWATDDQRGLGPATNSRRYAREVLPGRGILDYFVALADAPPEEVLNFARHWGILELCEHNLPASHNAPAHAPRATNTLVTWCHPRGWYDRTGKYDGWEPLEVWRQFSRQARALLHIAARLHLGQVGLPEDWRLVYERSPSPEPAPWWKQTVDGEKSKIADIVNEWLELGNVRVRTSWRPWRQPAPVVTLAGDGLFGALACQLLLAINRTDGLAICSGCGSPYCPSRRPRMDQRRYCPECRARKIPQRDTASDCRKDLSARRHQRKG